MACFAAPDEGKKRSGKVSPPPLFPSTSYVYPPSIPLLQHDAKGRRAGKQRKWRKEGEGGTTLLPVGWRSVGSGRWVGRWAHGNLYLHYPLLPSLSSSSSSSLDVCVCVCVWRCERGASPSTKQMSFSSLSLSPACTLALCS